MKHLLLLVLMALLCTAAAPRTAPAADADAQAKIKQAYSQLCAFARCSDADRAHFAQRGAPAVYLPVGGNDQGLLSELQQAELLPLCKFVDDQAIGSGALQDKSLLFLPDLDVYAPHPQRDEAIKTHLRSGGGIIAQGTAITHLHALGLFAATLIPYRARGDAVMYLAGYDQRRRDKSEVPSIYGDARATIQRIVDAQLLNELYTFSLPTVIRDGPLFRLPAENAALQVGGFIALNHRPGYSNPDTPGIAYGAVGAGRLVLTAASATGAASNDSLLNPVPLDSVAEPTWEDLRNTLYLIVRKQLWLYAAGDTHSPLRQQGTAP